MLRNACLLVLVASLIVIFNCGNPNSRDSVILKVPVTIEEVTRGDIALFISLTGTLLPAAEMPIVPEVGGEISYSSVNRKPLKNGDSVIKGQIVAEIINEEYLLGIRIETKRMAKDQAARDLEEKKKLGSMGGIPPREVEAAERNKIDTEISYQSALNDIEKMNVKAPMSGILTDVKSMVEGLKIGANTELAKVMDYRRVRCELNITNDNISRVSEGQEVTVVNFAYEDEPFTGHITKINPTIDPATRTFKVELEVENPDMRLRPGMFVKADIVVSKRSDVIRIPKHTIKTRSNRSIVFIVEDQVAKEREVTIGLQDAEFAEIIDGIEEGDLLIIRGFETLRDNTKVRVSR